MTLRNIEIFLALARTPNMREVAARLFLSQAGVSSSLREMESELGLSVFDRVGRGIRLNEKGRLLASYLAPLYRQLNDCLEVVMSDEMVGDIHLGASTTLADYVLPQILCDFKKQHDRVNISFESASTREIVQRIESGLLDMGFVEGEVTTPKVRTTTLHEDHLVVVTSDKQLADAGPYRIDQLMQANWLLRQEGSGTRATFLHQVMQKGRAPNIFMEFSNNDAIKIVLRNKGTLACFSPLVAETELRLGELFIVPISDTFFLRTFKQVLHRDRPLSPLLQCVTQAVSDKLSLKKSQRP